MLPCRGEVRVRVLASSLQYTDVLIRRHLYPQTARLRTPFVIGYDVVGEIDQLGQGVAHNVGWGCQARWGPALARAPSIDALAARLQSRAVGWLAPSCCVETSAYYSRSSEVV